MCQTKGPGAKIHPANTHKFWTSPFNFFKGFMAFSTDKDLFSALQKLLVFTILHIYFLQFMLQKVKQKTDFFHLKEQHLFVMQQY